MSGDAPSTRLSSVTEPNGVSESFTYDPATGQRASTTVNTPGSGSVVTDDYYQAGRLAYQTDGGGTLLASYTYDSAGAPVSVQVGSDPATAPRYYYVYDARGDVVNLTDVAGNVVASYSYDTWGALTSSSESIPGAGNWFNPYRFDGRDGVQSDPATGLDWMATRAYDPTIGRFLAQDPLHRTPLFFADNPYVYAGNDPVSNIDPSGQYRAAGFGSTERESGQATNQQMARIQAVSGCDKACQTTRQQEMVAGRIAQAKGIAGQAKAYFSAQAKTGTLLGLVFTQPLSGTTIVSFILQWIDTNILSSPWALLGTAYKALTGGVFFYDIVAAYIALQFQDEAAQSAVWWLDPSNNLSFSFNRMHAFAMLMGAVVGAVMIGLTVLAPQLEPLWVLTGVGSMAAIFSLIPKAQEYIDQEEQVFGYAES